MLKKLGFILIIPLCWSLPVAPEFLTSKKAIGAVSLIVAGALVHRYMRQSSTPDTSAQACNIVTWMPQSNRNSTTPHDQEAVSEVSTLDDLALQLRSYKDWDTTKHFNIPVRTGKNQQQLKSYTVKKGVPEGETRPIFIYSAGWAGGIYGSTVKKKYRLHGVGSYLVHRAIERNIMHGICVAFDYPTDARAAFNFAQHNDLACLKNIIAELVHKNPHAPIILMGDCKGSVTVLRFLLDPSHHDLLKNLKAVFLESPSVSLQMLAHHVADSYVGSWARNLIYPIFQWYFPAFSPECDKQQASLLLNDQDVKFPDVPMLIAHVIGDKIASDEGSQLIAHKFASTGNEHIYWCLAGSCQSNYSTKLCPTVQNPKQYGHGKMLNIEGIQDTVNAFFNTCGLPCDEVAAKRGSKALEKSKLPCFFETN